MIINLEQHQKSKYAKQSLQGLRQMYITNLFRARVISKTVAPVTLHAGDEVMQCLMMPTTGMQVSLEQINKLAISKGFEQGAYCKDTNASQDGYVK